MVDELRVVVASYNPVKLESARQGFMRVFPGANIIVSGIDVPSGVSDQPMSDRETLDGACHRAANAQAACPDAAYWVGIEGGCEEVDGVLQTFAWIVVQSAERQGRGRTGTFILPDEVAHWVHQGLELGDADDRVFNRQNSKQQNGSIGILTGDIIDRVGFYAPAVILALIPFINPRLTFSRR